MHAPIRILALFAAVDLSLTSCALLRSGFAAHDTDQGIGGSVHLCFARHEATTSPGGLWKDRLCLPAVAVCDLQLQVD